MPENLQPQATEPAVVLSNVTYRWGRSAATPPTLDIPELVIAKGERVFVAGPSGTGKTTLLNLLCGINTPTTGELWVSGQPLHTLNNAQRDRFRCDHVGVIFQQFNLLPYLSVIDNVILACRLSKRRRHDIHTRNTTPDAEAHRLLKALHLDDALHTLPIQHLSVGQQQRVAAARAFMGSPEIIIADEPTSALDNDRQQAFIALLKDQCERTNATLIFVSHNMALTHFFDRVIALKQVQRNGSATHA